MGRARDHRVRMDATQCPDPAACARLYHGLGGPEPGDTCECCGQAVQSPPMLSEAARESFERAAAMLAEARRMEQAARELAISVLPTVVATMRKSDAGRALGISRPTLDAWLAERE